MGLGKYLKLAGRGIGKGLGLLGKAAGSAIYKSSPYIGKALGAYGRMTVHPSLRNVMSRAADTAIRLMPNGRVKETLSRINDAAQGHVSMSDNPYAHTRPALEHKTNRVVELDD